MTEIYDPFNFEKVCVNTVLEALREASPLYGPRAFGLCARKTREFPTSFRYLLMVILFENREELLPHLKSLAGSLDDHPDRETLAWALIQCFIHSILTPMTVRRLVEDDRASTDWLTQEMQILTRMAFSGVDI